MARPRKNPLAHRPPMLTREQALTVHGVWSLTHVDSNGTPSYCRRNGATKTWKTRPAEFSMPVKYGMYEAFRIEHTDAENYTALSPEDWPTE